MRLFASRAVACAAALAASALVGCAFGRLDRDIDRTPVVDTGVGASIIYPGQSPPVWASGGPPGSVPAGAGVTSAGESAGGGPALAQGTQSSSGSPGGGGSVTFIGGSRTEEQRHIDYRENPSWFKYAVLPFAVLAAPFKYVADALRDEPEPGPELPRSEPKGAPAPAPPSDYETAMLEQMGRELATRQGAEAAESAPRARASRHEPGRLSIAHELSGLQRATAPGAARAPTPGPEVAPQPEGTPHAATGEPDGIVDRNGDGRIDHWIYREGGAIAREAFDEDFDGRPDRTLHYDPTTGQVHQLEEDIDQDGAADSWSDYHNGRVIQRRADTDHNGSVDTWTFYRDGEVTRHERDTNGDGIRDRVGFYVDGRLTLEKQDHNADGQPDVTLHYDAKERIARKEEDTDGDGQLDVISHFEAGRLTRRDLLNPDLLNAAEAPSP
ncbi:MAG: hypothetical protein V3U03_04715 [Myxococcota bacterium]